MDWGVRLPLLLLLLLPATKGNPPTSHNQPHLNSFTTLAQWEDPALSDPQNEYVTFQYIDGGTDKFYLINMDEELPPPIIIAKLNYKGIRPFFIATVIKLITL